MSTQPWLDALEAKRVLEATYAKAAESGRLPGMLGVGLTPEFVRKELTSLRIADTYSFSGMALQAIHQAARSVPMDTTLQISHCPRGGSGFWWFDEPLPIRTSSIDVGCQAIMWEFLVEVSSSQMRNAKIVEDEVESAIRGERMVKMEIDEECPFHMAFTGFVRSPKYGFLLPTIGWKWKGSEPMTQMLEQCRVSYEREKQIDELGTEFTMHAIQHLSEFFIAAAVWIEQEILEDHPITIRKATVGESRSERKRAARSTVRIVQLRKKHFLPGSEEQVETTPTGAKTREWTCQWVVKGHWTHQPYGPGRTLRKLIYRNPYIKGPDDKPLRPVRPTVHAVMR